MMALCTLYRIKLKKVKVFLDQMHYNIHASILSRIVALLFQL